MAGLGKTLILFGAVLVVLGVVLLFGERIPWLGRLPGDFRIEREHFSFYFPITTSIILSVILTVLFWLFRR